jgi:NADPH2:quinone reductase
VIPGDDGAGVVDRVGPGVPEGWIGRRVWIHSANYGRPFGTSAEYVVVPAAQAIELPATTSFEVGACLGVPALTAHFSVFADGPVEGRTVLVTGGAGAVGHYAIELAKNAGATVIATGSSPEKQQAARAAGAEHVLGYREPNVVEAILELAPGGVDRVVDVAFGANLPLTSAAVALNGTIASYGSDAVPEPAVPFYTLMRRGVTIRLISVFTMPSSVLRAAVDDITRLLSGDVLTHPIAARFPLDDIVSAHEAVEKGAGIGKVLLHR